MNSVYVDIILLQINTVIFLCAYSAPQNVYFYANHKNASTEIYADLFLNCVTPFKFLIMSIANKRP